MRKLKLLWSVFRSLNADKIIICFIFTLLLFSLLFSVIEPNIPTFGAGIWYSFSVITTTGFGDYVAVTTLGRILTIILGIISIFVVALIPGIVVSYFIEFKKIKRNQNKIEILDKLENLDKLSKSELKTISENIKKRKYKI